MQHGITAGDLYGGIGNTKWRRTGEQRLFAVLSHKKPQEIPSLGEPISKQKKAILLKVSSATGELSAADSVRLSCLDKSGLTSLAGFLLTLTNILPEYLNSFVFNEQI